MEFETDRLRAEPLDASHRRWYFALERDPRVMETLGGMRSDSEVEGRIVHGLEHWERHGYGMWMFFDRADRSFVGRAAVRNVHIGGRDEVEIGYAVAADRWGEGLATEMARALVRVAFDELGIEELVCFTLPTNRASERVMQKAGFEYEREVEYAGLPHVLYRQRRRRPVRGARGFGARP